MERERQEPTFGTPDLKDMQFRSERAHQIKQRDPAPPWALIAGGVVLAVVIIMGLIEWNARRQATAITRELTRPMTAAEEAKLKADMAVLDRELRAAVEAARPRTRNMRPPVEIHEPSPLRAGERCIRGNRFKRIEGGWKDVPNDPC